VSGVLPEPAEGTILAWFDLNADLHAVAYRTDQWVESGAETYRWYITDGDGRGDPLEWHDLLSEMQDFRGPSVLLSQGRLGPP
jgi:hypothetical protein